MIHISFHELAKKELFEARDYYDELVFGLGKLFIFEIERCLNIIKVNPLAYPAIKLKIREAVVLKFPYSILYRFEENNVYIVAIMHQKKKPKYWQTRT